MIEFTERDLQQFKEKGITPERVQQQINNFIKGFPFVHLHSAATPGKGLMVPPPEQAQQLVELYDDLVHHLEVVKFVPASGAASRMFKALFAFRLQWREEGEAALGAETDFASPAYFFKHIRRFAFYDALQKCMLEDGHDLEKALEVRDYAVVLDYFLTDKGLNYGNLPKGLLLFHAYDEGARLAIEEHLMEGIHYTRDRAGKVRLHFTISPAHQQKFEEAFARVVPRYEKDYQVQFDLQTSIQKASTDTIAVDMENRPFRLADGSILFRPGGHGALIENLNELDADLIFIKNIDNVVPDHLRDQTYYYKKVLGGKLLEVQENSFEYLELLDCAQVDDELLEEMKNYLVEEMAYEMREDFDAFNRIEKVDFLYNKFNRPIRVCGMVKNEGEPGGGPFRVIKHGELSLQIVESSQIDFSDEGQSEIVKNATHFNPVDLVCSTKNYKGERFDYLRYIDPETGFISIKSKDGRELKAQELPGLWNGAMADWNTLFVEVPLITFNPVKIVNDLLRPTHQNA